MIRVIAFDLNGVVFPTFSKLNSKVWDLIKECKSLGYRVVAASNSSKSAFEFRNRVFGLMNVFDGRIISSDLGYRKPDRPFYEEMINILGCKPEELLFIDDSEENIQIAKEVGIITVFFEGNESIDKIREILDDEREDTESD